MPKLSYVGVVTLHYAINQLNATTHTTLFGFTAHLSHCSGPIDMMHDKYYSQQITRKNLNVEKTLKIKQRDVVSLETEVRYH